MRFFHYLKRVFYYAGVIVTGWQQAGKLVKKYPDCRMLITYESIGERTFMLAYVRAYQRYHHIEDLKIITSRPGDPLFQYWGIKEENLIVLDEWKLKNLYRFFFNNVGEWFLYHHKQIVPLNQLAYIRQNGILQWNDHFPDFGIMLKAFYRIPQDTVPEIRQIPKADKLIAGLKEKGILQEKKTILINPYASTCSQVPVDFFNRLSRLLQDSGISVIYSQRNGMEEMKDTVGVDFSIGEAVALMNECLCVVGLRSGFLDLATFSDVPIVSVGSVDFECNEFYRLEKCWPMRGNIFTVIWGAGMETELLETIKQFIEEKLYHVEKE